MIVTITFLSSIFFSTLKFEDRVIGAVRTTVAVEFYDVAQDGFVACCVEVLFQFLTCSLDPFSLRHF